MRKRVLVRPGFQLRLVASFLGIAAMSMALQYVLLGFLLQEAVVSAESRGHSVVDVVPLVLTQVGALSLCLLLPAMAAVGVLRTFRIAGPIYRFESHLADVAAGKDLGPCRLRKGDELQGLCERINGTVAALRAETAKTTDENRRAA